MFLLWRIGGVVLAAAALVATGCRPDPGGVANGTTAELAGAGANAAEPVPMYRPSIHSPAPVDITTNEYGAYGAAPRALEVGDTVADFVLPRMTGGTFSLAEARAEGPVAIVFFRGFW